jgi:hypothetical protein
MHDSMVVLENSEFEKLHPTNEDPTIFTLFDFVLEKIDEEKFDPLKLVPPTKAASEKSENGKMLLSNVHPLNLDPFQEDPVAAVRVKSDSINTQSMTFDRFNDLL